MAEDHRPPTLAEIRTAKERFGALIAETPVWNLRGNLLERAVGAETAVFLKLELFQFAGTFKPRGALTVMLSLTRPVLDRGVTAVSAGNHAMAVAYAARALKTTAKVVMPKNANPARVAGCKAYGAQVELVDDVHQAFERVHQIEAEEGRTFVHPFEGPLTATGTATVGLELCAQVPQLDAVIVPIGGGGLCAGVATAVKLTQPRCLVFGVEPAGADTMHRSFASGKPEAIDKVRTIADSFGAPYALPYSFSLCRKFVDELVPVDDPALQRAMLLLFREAKLAVEPAGAASTAALCGPLRERLRGKRVGLIVCGTNIDPAGFSAHIAAAMAEEAKAAK